MITQIQNAVTIINANHVEIPNAEFFVPWPIGMEPEVNFTKEDYLTKGKGTAFQSYNVIVAANLCIGDSREFIYLDEKYWDYSRTTLRHLSAWLGVKGVKEIRERVDQGRYLLADLN